MAEKGAKFSFGGKLQGLKIRPAPGGEVPEAPLALDAGPALEPQDVPQVDAKPALTLDWTTNRFFAYKRINGVAYQAIIEWEYGGLREIPGPSHWTFAIYRDNGTPGQALIQSGSTETNDDAIAMGIVEDILETIVEGGVS